MITQDMLGYGQRGPPAQDEPHPAAAALEAALESSQEGDSYSDHQQQAASQIPVGTHLSDNVVATMHFDHDLDPDNNDSWHQQDDIKSQAFAFTDKFSRESVQVDQPPTFSDDEARYLEAAVTESLQGTLENSSARIETREDGHTYIVVEAGTPERTDAGSEGNSDSDYDSDDSQTDVYEIADDVISMVEDVIAEQIPHDSSEEPAETSANSPPGELQAFSNYYMAQ